MLVRIEVFSRPDLLDAQSKAVLHAVRLLGHQGIQGLRVGRLIELELAVADRAEAEALVAELVQTLLVHPVTEDWRLVWPGDEAGWSTPGHP